MTISLSNAKSPQQSYAKKLIKLKPIELKKQTELNMDGPLSVEEEKVLIQNELESARTELNHLKQEKERMLQSAIKEIKTEKENWEEEKRILIEQAHDIGYDSGFKQGEQEAMEQYHQKIDQINGLVDTATKDYHTTIEQSDKVIVDLSIHTAEKVIKEKLAEDPKMLLTIVTAAIQDIKDQSMISIFLHPNNYEFLVNQKSELMSAMDGDTKISIYIDQKMTENDCLIEHPFGQIDASIDTQLEQIREALHQVTMENKS